MKSLAALVSVIACTSAQSSSTSLVNAISRSASPTTRSFASFTSTSTYSQSNVPTGTAIPGNYDGDYRPQVHYSPPQGFMNGLVLNVKCVGCHTDYLQIQMACSLMKMEHTTFTTNVRPLSLMLEQKLTAARQSHCECGWQSTLGPRDESRPLHMDEPTHRSLPGRSDRRRFLGLCSSRREQHFRFLPQSD